MALDFDPKCRSALSMGLFLGACSTTVGAVAIQCIRKWFRSSNAKATPSLTEEQAKLIKTIAILSEKILINPRCWCFEHCFRVAGTKEVSAIAQGLKGAHIPTVESRIRSLSFWGVEQNPTCVLKKLVYATGLTRDAVAAQVPSFRMLLSAVVEATATTRMTQEALDIVFPQTEPGLPGDLRASI